MTGGMRCDDERLTGMCPDEWRDIALWCDALRLTGWHALLLLPRHPGCGLSCGVTRPSRLPSTTLAITPACIVLITYCISPSSSSTAAATATARRHMTQMFIYRLLIFN